MKRRTFALGACVAVALLASACGSDSQSHSQCDRLANGLATATNDCHTYPYAQEYPLFQQQCQGKSFDEAKLDQCLSDLQNVDCPSIQANVFPASCKNIE